MLNTKTSNNAAKEGFNKEPKAMPSDTLQSYTFSAIEINLTDKILQCIKEYPILISQSIPITASLDNLAAQFKALNEQKKTNTSLASEDLIYLFTLLNHTETELDIKDVINLEDGNYDITLKALTDRLYNWQNETTIGASSKLEKPTHTHNVNKNAPCLYEYEINPKDLKAITEVFQYVLRNADWAINDTDKFDETDQEKLRLLIEKFNENAAKKNAPLKLNFTECSTLAHSAYIVSDATYLNDEIEAIKQNNGLEDICEFLDNFSTQAINFEKQVIKASLANAPFSSPANT